MSLQSLYNFGSNTSNSTITSSVNNVNIQQLPASWPKTLAPDSRAWVVQSITDGIADATLKTNIITTGNITHVKSLSGNISIKDGVLTNYYKQFPDITHIDADIAYTADKMNITLNKGYQVLILLTVQKYTYLIWQTTRN